MRSRTPAPAGTARSHRLRWLIAPIGAAAVVASMLVAGMQSADAAAGSLLSQGRPALASSSELGETPAAAAVDGNNATRWASAWSDPQWLRVDLGSTATISQVVLQWETAYGKAFQIQTSPDGNAWTSIYNTTTG